MKIGLGIKISGVNESQPTHPFSSCEAFDTTSWDVLMQGIFLECRLGDMSGKRAASYKTSRRLLQDDLRAYSSASNTQLPDCTWGLSHSDVFGQVW
jgi:hypothetical protein